MKRLNPNIRLAEDEIIDHLKACEKYVHVIFTYSSNNIWDGWIPIEYRRTGVNIQSNDELIQYLNMIYEQINPDCLDSWLAKQNRFWQNEKSRAKVTKTFFDSLVSGGWKCLGCDLPKNPNPTKRIQEL